MMRQLFKFFNSKNKWFSETISLHKKAFWHGRDLKASQNNTHNIKTKDILLFAVMKNEAHRLAFFLDYYRKLGVGHFILVDNGSTDNFKEIVADQNDISTFYTTASYKESNFGMYWANYLLLKYGCDHWCMTCDPDEFLVYPYMETRDLRDLKEYLDSIKQPAFFTTMIDMYSDKAVEDSFYQEGDNPLLTCPYFDATGYTKSHGYNYKNAFIQGGVRRRVFYADNPVKAPALNKIPLVKWRFTHSYIESMHMAIPRKLNKAFDPVKTSGALLHFKFISQLMNKVQEEHIAQQHWDNSSEYKKYGNAIKNKTILYDPSISTRFEGWQTLASCGLLNVGEW